MSVSVKNRVTLIDIALLLFVVLIGWVVVYAFGKVSQKNWLPGSLRDVQSQFFQIADNVQPAIEGLNSQLIRFATTRDRAEWDLFQQNSLKLKEWITKHEQSAPRSKLIIVDSLSQTVELSTLLGKIGQTYDFYLTAAFQVEKDIAVAPPSSLISQSLVDATERANQLIALANQARANGRAIEAHAHGRVIDLFVEGPSQQFSWFLPLMLALMLVLIGLAAWVSAFVYQRVVSPLRQKIVESDTIIERQQKLATFGQLAAGVAHEVRNPLMAISARVFTLQRAHAPGTPEHEDAVVIRNEINRLDRIVTDFLELARPATPRLVLTTANAALREVRELLAPQLEKDDILLDLSPIDDIQFHADPGQLKQVLLNLVQNAADSMGGDGTITLRAHRDNLTLHGRNQNVAILEVQDTGPGIPVEVQKRLFDPFFSTKKTGTGLGLSIATQIMERHGGALDFITKMGKGTTFRVILPMPKEIA